MTKVRLSVQNKPKQPKKPVLRHILHKRH
jgi:hypothetical protein